MKQSEFKHLVTKNFKVAYLGSLDSENVVLFIRRSNTHKNSAPLQQLLDTLVLDGYLLLWPENQFETISKFLDGKSHKILSWLDQVCGAKESFLKISMRRLLKGLTLLCYPGKWHFFINWFFSHPIANDLKLNRQVISTLCKNKSVTILSHSAGGIVASYLSHEPNLKNIVCFGYPFKNPERPEEPYRTAHLKQIQKPFLIIQGAQDEYGGLDVQNRYDLSPTIRLEFVNASHDYESLSHEDWSRVVKSIQSFIA